jgi:hypothetical protein
MDWVSSEECENYHLRFWHLRPEDIASVRATVATWPALSRNQWRRVARILGLTVAGDGPEPIGGEGARGHQDPL